MNQLYMIWKEEFGNNEFSWEEIQNKLYEAVAPAKVVEINSRSNDKLDYEQYKEGLNIIAIGGFSLSRGLTLEGLSVSYFLRNSIMYDTLMQMGRWFGYRPSYDDLCRIFMPGHAAGWYAHISEAIEELRVEFREMDLAGLTPKDFGLKVRSHPESLIVTARNKMRTGETVYRLIDLSERLIETDKLHSNTDKIEHNKRAFKELIKKLSSFRNPEITDIKNYLWKDVSIDLVTEFIHRFINHQASLRTQTKPVLEFIKKRQNYEFRLWDVVIINKDSVKSEEKEDVYTGISVGAQNRTIGSKSEQLQDCIIVGEKARVGSTADESEGLTRKELEEAEGLFEKDQSTEKPRSISGTYYRKTRKKPLLMLHLLNIVNKAKQPEYTGVVAYGISFPKSKKTGKSSQI